MSTRLLDLEDRIVTDTGSMVAKYELLIKLALDGERFDHIPFEPNSDIDRYHKSNGTSDVALRWRETYGDMTGPSPSTYAWNTPAEYVDISIPDMCEQALVNNKLINDPAYIERLIEELDLVEKRGMGDFFKCLVWITATMRANRVVWGLGRGSSCASLVLFLLGVNKVDPVKYDIPKEEFYK